MAKSSYAGTVKSFNPGKGWGFIECEETFTLYGKDVFVMRTGLPRGYAEKGDQVKFTVFDGKTGPEAKCTDQYAASGASHYVGTIKSFVAQKGWGLIECEDTFHEYGKDMFVLRTSLPNQHADRGDRVRFTVTQGEKGPEAAEVQFIQQHSQTKQQPQLGRGASRQVPYNPIVQRVAPQQASFVVPWGPAPQWSGKGEFVLHGMKGNGKGEQRMLQKGHVGVVKSYSDQKGWGFIVPSTAQFGKDLFVMKTALTSGHALQVGEKVQFKIKIGQKGYEADEVHVVPNVQELPKQPITGTVKSYNAAKGWGFIESAEVRKIFGRDILFHKKDLVDHEPAQGEQVQFSIGENRNGQQQAVNLSFGGGFKFSAKIQPSSRAKPY